MGLAFCGVVRDGEEGVEIWLLVEGLEGCEEGVEEVEGYDEDLEAATVGGVFWGAWGGFWGCGGAVD